MGSDYLACLVSQFSTFPSDLQPVLFYLLLYPPSVLVFKVWNSSVTRSASDSAFRSVFCFQRGLPQGGSCYLRVAATLYLGFCTQLREQIHQSMASVYSGNHNHLLEPTKGTRDLMLPWPWSLPESILWSPPTHMQHRTTYMFVPSNGQMIRPRFFN